MLYQVIHLRLSINVDAIRLHFHHLIGNGSMTGDSKSIKILTKKAGFMVNAGNTSFIMTPLRGTSTCKRTYKVSLTLLYFFVIIAKGVRTTLLDDGCGSVKEFTPGKTRDRGTEQISNLRG